MRPSKSQFEQMKPDALHAAVQSVGSLTEQFSGAVGDVEGAQKTIAENFLGTAGDAEHETATGKIAGLHRDLDSLKQAQTTLASAGDGLVTASNNLKTVIGQVEQSGFKISDDWSIKPANNDPRVTLQDLQKAQNCKKQLDECVTAWDQADHNTSQAIQQAVDQLTGKAHQEPTTPAPQPTPTPKPDGKGPKDGDGKDTPPADSGSHMPGASAKPGDPGYVVPKADGDSAEFPSSPGWKSDVPGADNPPGYPPVGPGAQRDQNWKDYLKGKNADGSMRPAGQIPASYPNPESVGDKGLKIVGAAARQQGTRYVWGGGSPNGATHSGTHDGGKLGDQRHDYDHKGFDCSGLSEYSIYQATGIDPGKGSGTQLENQQAGGAHAYGHVIAGPNAASIDESQLQPGDVIYYGSGGSQHVAIYVGDGVTVETNTSGTPAHFENRGPGLKDGTNPISVVRPNS